MEQNNKIDRHHAAHEYVAFRDWVYKVAPHLQNDLLDPDMEKRVPFIGSFAAQGLESIILAMWFLEEYSGFANAKPDEKFKISLWQNQSLQFNIFHIPYVLQYMSNAYLTDQFSAIYDKDNKKDIQELAKFLACLSRNYMYTFLGEENATYDDDGNLVRYDVQTEPERTAYQKQLPVKSIWKSGKTKTRQPSRSIKAYIKSFFKLDLDEQFNWNSEQLCPALVVLRALMAPLLSLASSSGVQYCMEGLYQNTQFLDLPERLVYRRMFPQTEYAIQLFSVPIIPIVLKDAYFRFIINPMITFNVIYSYYLQMPEQKADITEIDPTLKEKRDETAKQEEKTFQVEKY